MFSSTCDLVSCCSDRGIARKKTHLRDGHIKVEIETQDCASQEYDKDGERGIFEVGQLNFHTSEFHSPSDR